MISASDLLLQADRLLAAGTEVDRRTAVSRAYYGAYHVARGFLVQRCGIVLSKGADVHQAMQRCLLNSQNDLLRDAGIRLESLRSERNRADYDLDDPRFTDAVRAQIQIQRAREILGKLAEAEKNLLSFQQVVRVYASGVLKLQLKTLPK
jgi:uncharacterized protein (UPF0332 family)